MAVALRWFTVSYDELPCVANVVWHAKSVLLTRPSAGCGAFRIPYLSLTTSWKVRAFGNPPPNASGPDVASSSAER